MVTKYKITEKELKSLFKEWVENDKTFLTEEVNKDDIKSMIKKEIASLTKSDELEKKVTEMILKELKDNNQAKKYITEITKNVLADVYKTLWLKKTTLFSGI